MKAARAPIRMDQKAPSERGGGSVAVARIMGAQGVDTMGSRTETRSATAVASKASLVLLLVSIVPAQAAQCRLSLDECQAVDRELAAERDASIAANRRAQGLEPRAAILALADLKVRRMTARAQALPKPVAREFLRIAACDLDAEVARAGGRPSGGDCE